uniref:M-phase inducer phosphatase 2 isoform X2 n=1 Tax=Podarcis muralis TaxID=64176 RepID=UPI00109F4FFA|nr:M-phase inducer phosphatase 2 isoform X2 [Podarcis muralis]
MQAARRGMRAEHPRRQPRRRAELPRLHPASQPPIKTPLGATRIPDPLVQRASLSFCSVLAAPAFEKKSLRDIYFCFSPKHHLFHQGARRRGSLSPSLDACSWERAPTRVFAAEACSHHSLGSDSSSDFRGASRKKPGVSPASRLPAQQPQMETARVPAGSPPACREARRSRKTLGFLAVGPKTLFPDGDGAAAMSPVTTLALNMDKLTGLGSDCDTPKRRKRLGLDFKKEWSSQDSVSSESSQESGDSGMGPDSPMEPELEILEDVFERNMFGSQRVFRNDYLPIRRIQSLPVQFLGSSPRLRNISNRKEFNSPAAAETDSGLQGNGENEGAIFKKPLRPAGRLCLSGGGAGKKDPFAQRPNSAPDLMYSSPEKENRSPGSDSHVYLRRSSLTSFMVDEDNDDDGFLEILDEEDLKGDGNFPLGMENLLMAPLVRKEDESSLSPLGTGKCRRLFRSPSMPSAVIRPILKRLDRPQDKETPVKNKRRKSLAGGAIEEKEEEPVIHATKAASKGPRLVRSRSCCPSEIANILDNDHRELIGDFSKAYVLQTVEGKHQDLKYISPEMMAAVLMGQFSNLIENCVIVDCRYPYEYEGGHIKGAVNLPLEKDVEEFLLKKPIVPCDPSKRVIVVFHCEFSSERGPRTCRFVREKDRASNEYPSLHYPELYVLKGGYKEFFPQYQMHCEPQNYRPMHHKDFKEDLRNFRLKSRTWAGEKSKRELYSRLKNF